MDLTPIISLAGVLVGSLATFGGVWLNARANRRTEDKRLAIEAEREATRLRREDEATLRAAVEATARRQTDTYDQLAQMFVGELSNLRALAATDTDLRYLKFTRAFLPQWLIHGDTRIRRVVAGLTSDQHRLRVTQILDSIVDHEQSRLWSSWSPPSRSRFSCCSGST